MPTEFEIEKKLNNGFRLNADLVKWLLMIAFSAGMVYASVRYETQNHANDTYVKKEVFDEVQKNEGLDRTELFKRLDKIEEKLDRLNEKRNK